MGPPALQFQMEDALQNRYRALLTEVEQVIGDPKIARSVVDWALGSGIFGDAAVPEAFDACAKEVKVASVFAARCSPSRVDGVQLAGAIRLLVLFLWLDDLAASRALDDEQWRLHLQELHLAVLGCPSSLSAGHRHWSIWLDEYTAVARSPRARALFAARLSRFLVELDNERRVDRSSIGIERYWEIRRETIFVKVFGDYWRGCLGIELSALDEIRVRVLQDLACEVIVMSNDLASVAREQQGRDLNLVFVLTGLGTLLSEAIDAVVGDHNDAVERYRSEREQVLAGEPRGSALGAYIGLLTVQISGNWVSMVELSERYPRCAAVIGRLARLQ